MIQTRSPRLGLRRAFTLIELVAVMVVLAVLAGVAIPKYFDYADRAKTSSVQGTLGAVRTALANFYTEAAVAGDAAYPTLAEIRTVGTVMQEAIPANPYNNLSTIQRITVLADAQNRAVSNTTQFGWNYYFDNNANPPVTIFWANSTDQTTVLNANGQPIRANRL
ncbi:MAG: prepilin-type N-terminal cleavage/methylation domain-containing protein [Phycisphaerales bacterium]|nr:prepilin-type N-terminal cleavage/methylation domain-containing protein [Phycisphaerales bacterium]